jgi:threonine/homoserine/homoserine lactone efflux protein
MMMTLPSLIYFLGASIALTVAPGPDNIFVISQGVTRGRKAAIITALGMCSGISVHTAAAALGLSAVFYSSAVAFQAVKFAGAGYLLFLAFKTLADRSFLSVEQTGTCSSAGVLFKRGFVMNVLNPKVALFFLAFLPQFVSRQSPFFAGEMLLFGLIFMIQAVIVFSVIGFFSGGIGDYLQQKPGVSRYLSWLTAGVFASLGIRLALAER